MDREIKPINYLPPFLRKIREMQEIYKGITPELSELYSNGEIALNEEFVLYAQNYGLERMEEILQITVDYDDTVENRRLRILTKLNGDTPYTFDTLYKKLKFLCGDGNVNMSYAKEIYTLNVQISLIAKRQFETVRKMLLEIVPCNIVLNCLLMYNTHRVVKNYTQTTQNIGHKSLHTYTHRKITEEVIEK